MNLNMAELTSKSIQMNGIHPENTGPGDLLTPGEIRGNIGPGDDDTIFTADINVHQWFFME